MAFSPFTWFRKHQKVFFAGLTVVCMFVFIGQAGFSADIFKDVLYWLGANRGGTVVATLYGKKVTQPELEQLARQRRLANEFMLSASFQAQEKAIKELLEKRLKSDGEGGNPLAGLREVVEEAQRRSGIGMFQQDPRVAAPRIQSNFAELPLIASRVKDDKDRLALLHDVASILGFQAWWYSTPRTSYFGGAPQARRERELSPAAVQELLDFRVWLHQADVMGLILTDADVAKEVNLAGAGQPILGEKVNSLEREKKIVEYARNLEGGSVRDLAEGLRQEYRVVLAQGMLLGVEPGVRRYRRRLGVQESPGVGTSDQFFRFFRENRTVLRVKMLPVAVSAFEGKVKTRPSEQELLNRYKRFRDQEPAPTSRNPGFKEPRRVAVSYLVGDPHEPYYQESARLLGRVSRPAAAVGLATPHTGGLLGGLAPVLFDPVQAAYDRYLAESHPWVSQDSEDRWVQERRVGMLHDTSLKNKRGWNIASGLGGLAGSMAGVGSPFAGASLFYGTSAWDEVKGAVKQNAALLLARANPANPLGAVALAQTLAPEVTPLKELAPELVYEQEQRLAAEMLSKNLGTVQTELSKMKGKDRGAVQAYLKEAAAKYHLSLHAMTEPLTQAAMAEALDHKNDLKIGGLHEAWLDRNKGLKPDRFVEAVFAGAGTNEGQTLDGPEGKQYLFWRSQDKAAHVVRFAEARAAVEREWKFAEARKLARKEAERLEAEINDRKLSADQAVALLQKQGLGQVFELENVSLLVAPREVHEQIPTEYSRYQVPADKAPLLRYPPADMVKHLLGLKRPGQATVIADQPAAQFYVAVLVGREEPTVQQFVGLYERAPRLDMLYNLFQGQQVEDYSRDVMDQLRREAGKVDKDGRFVLAEGFRQRESAGDEE